MSGLPQNHSHKIESNSSVIIFIAQFGWKDNIEFSSFRYTLFVRPVSGEGQPILIDVSRKRNDRVR